MKLLKYVLHSHSAFFFFKEKDVLKTQHSLHGTSVGKKMRFENENLFSGIARDH